MQNSNKNLLSIERVRSPSLWDLSRSKSMWSN